jgi:putative tryptophan/tyrosine transport system substrate-binding protein
MQAAAQTLGIGLSILYAGTPNEIDMAFAEIERQRIGALFVDADTSFYTLLEHLVPLSARYGVPTIYQTREHVDARGLMSYGANISDAFRLAGVYAGRILKGEKPAELPVQQPTRIELIINLKTARALGLTVPLALLGRADEIIE